MIDLDSILKGCASPSPNMLNTLQKVQEAFGYVPQDAIPKIAATLGVSESDVAGVLSFYHDLRTTPPGRHTIRFCLGESCLATHCKKSLKAIEKKIGCTLGETSKDGRFTLEKVYCLGNCALSPSLMIDEDVHGRSSLRDVSGLLKNYK